MRAFLDKLYDTAGYAAAVFMVGTLLMVVAGIVDRVFAFGWRGTDMYAGYAMAACGFLALAHTLKRGEHIRVSLILQAVSSKHRRMLDIWSMSVASILSGAFAYYAISKPTCARWRDAYNFSLKLSDSAAGGIAPGCVSAQTTM